MTASTSDVPLWRQHLVQFDISHNAIPLAFFAFTAMLSTASTRLDIFSVPSAIPTIFFSFSVVILAISAILTTARIIIFPPALQADFSHPRLSNFFFLPAIIGPLALLTSPSGVRSIGSFRAGFYLIGVYQVSLALYTFGDWLFAAAPTASIYPLVFMQTIGFFLLSIVASTARMPEIAFAFLSVGLLFWLLVFFTNFQHVSGVLGKRTERPQPAFFLFIAPPAQAAIAFVMLDAAEAATGTGLLNAAGPLPWGRPAEFMLFVDLFLYMLMFRLFPTWCREEFKITWWAYVFPLSGAASAVILRYESEDKLFWGVVSVFLFIVAATAMLIVFCLTVWAFWTGKAPKHEACLRSYETYYASFHSSGPDLEAGE